ncbi:MAG: formylglycine-generating enzyme family protein [Magnetococcales bacterium]|nr:formylglycine-generating enzyme family protein [Magnetococcales bacterium]
MITRSRIWLPIMIVLMMGAGTLLAEPKAGEEHLFDGTPFVWVPGGTFPMGCEVSRECFEHEQPVHPVTLSGFWLGKTEVTQGQWKALMGTNPSRFNECGENCPVESVSWDDVQAFIKKLNDRGDGKYRMPTEAEWEYACRSGGKAEKYAGGNNADPVSWHHDQDKEGKTHPVGTKAANGLGLSDMSGNVWEWVQDWKGDYWTEVKISDPSTRT